MEFAQLETQEMMRLLARRIAAEEPAVDKGAAYCMEVVLTQEQKAGTGQAWRLIKQRTLR